VTTAPTQTWSDTFTTRSQGAAAAHGAYAGAIGASVIALFFLAVDAALRSPLWTPSLVGDALFRGASPAGTGQVDLGLVGLYSLLHAALFLGFGAGVALLLARQPRRPRPAVVALLCFLALELGILAGSRLLAPGLAGSVGIGWISLGNALAALGMTAWLCDEVPIAGSAARR
jgi:hypothetical protein